MSAVRLPAETGELRGPEGLRDARRLAGGDVEGLPGDKGDAPANGQGRNSLPAHRKVSETSASDGIPAFMQCSGIEHPSFVSVCNTEEFDHVRA